MEKPDKRILIYGLIFMLGVSVMLYPMISNMWNTHRSQQLVTAYQEAVNSGSTDLEQEMTVARIYNGQLLPSKVPDAFSTRDGITDKDYEDILNVDGNGMMGYITIPSIDVEVPIYHYTNNESLKKGAGHLLGSSLPTGGKDTHAVISAHRGLPSAKLFRDLNLLEKGDGFYIHVLGKTLKYEVDQILTVEPDQTEALARDPEKDLVTLVTCTPYGVNTHRLLVRGHRVPNDKEVSDAQKGNLKRILATIACIVIGILLAYILSKIMDRRRNGEFVLPDESRRK